jgi:predicted TIM-barrel fold metal-dependent hydrolase
MWSSDYPHTAATFPRSQEIVAKRFGALPDEQRRKIVHDTAAPCTD